MYGIVTLYSSVAHYWRIPNHINSDTSRCCESKRWNMRIISSDMYALRHTPPRARPISELLKRYGPIPIIKFDIGYQ